LSCALWLEPGFASAPSINNSGAASPCTTPITCSASLATLTPTCFISAAAPRPPIAAPKACESATFSLIAQRNSMPSCAP
jgi:hypothetical protein